MIIAAVTLADLEVDTPEAHLALIEQAQTELEALGAGMHGLTGDDRARQNAAWSAQAQALHVIVAVALAAGVPAEQITPITHR